ncbi:MAG: hypothetical protein GY777_31400 [Candidatus Brocadiaceae bacterium]|nr:hypothetical protein [Candidatus Brocadiaceae bacterium]
MSKKIIISAITFVIVTGIAVFSLVNKGIVTGAYCMVGCVLGGDQDWIINHKIHITKCGHIFGYFLITFLLISCGFFGTFLSVFIVLSMGGIFELLQILTPDRYALFGDLGYNSTGIIAALVLVWIWKLISQRKGTHAEALGRGERY